jgi:antibiotic biosynthesis monooxygenase (ABM) superfamily enzyme
MHRRLYLKALLAFGGGASLARAQRGKKGIMLHLDMVVVPAKEKEMLHTFHTIFRPAAAKFPGFIDVQIIKLRSVVMGKAPAGLNYRFVLTYESEELRQRWIASDVHQKVWPPIENTLVSKDYTVLLLDIT